MLASIRPWIQSQAETASGPLLGLSQIKLPRGSVWSSECPVSAVSYEFILEERTQSTHGSRTYFLVLSPLRNSTLHDLLSFLETLRFISGRIDA